MYQVVNFLVLDQEGIYEKEFYNFVKKKIDQWENVELYIKNMWFLAVREIISYFTVLVQV